MRRARRFVLGRSYAFEIYRERCAPENYFLIFSLIPLLCAPLPVAK